MVSEVEAREPVAWRRGEVVALAGGIVLLVGLLLSVYGPSLQLPISLIDDPTHIENSERLWENLGSQGPLEALRQDLSVRQRLYNPLFYFITAVLYALSGYAPFHWFKLLSLALVVAAMAAVPLVCSRSWPEPRWPALAGGLLTGVLLIVGEGPQAASFQSLMANWYRLHTTDSYLVLFAAPHMLAICCMLTLGREDSRRLWPIATVASMLLTLSISMKPVAAALVGPLAVMSGAAFALGARRLSGALAAVAVVGVVFAVGTVLLCRTLGPEGGRYSGAYQLTPEVLREGLAYYGGLVLDMLGPLGVLVFGGLLVRVMLARRYDDVPWRELSRREIVSAYLVLCFIAQTLACVPWPYRISRYFLPGFVPLAGAAGLECAAQLRLLRDTRWVGLCAGVTGGVAAWLILPVPWQPAVYLVLTGSLIYSHARHVVVGVMLAALMIGSGWTTWMGLTSAGNIRDYYVEREYRQQRLVEYLTKAVERGRRVGYAGDDQDEHIGSPKWLISRATRQQETLIPVRVEDDLARVDDVLICEFLRIDAPWISARGLKPVANFCPRKREIDVPVSYRDWQARLRSGGPFHALRRLGLLTCYAVLHVPR